MDSENQIDARWEELINEGILTPEGVDEDQEVVYIVDVEKLKKYDAMLYEAYKLDLDVYIAGLVGSGELELVVSANGDIFYLPTDQQAGWTTK